MLTEEMASTEIERARQEKGWRAILIRLLLVVLLAGLCTLAYGHTTAHGDGPAARVDSLQSAQQPTATPQQPAVVPSEVPPLEKRVMLLEATSEAMKEANDRNFYLFAFISGIVSLLGLATLATTFFKGKQEREDYQSERKFYEERVLDHEFRRKEENLRAGAMFDLQEANLEQVNKITTAIAAGARENVASLNTILATFQQIMDFKVSEAVNASKDLEKVKLQLGELEEAQRRQVEELLACATRLRRARHIYASPDPDLQRQMVEFRTQMDLMQRLVLERYTGLASPEQRAGVASSEQHTDATSLAQNRRYGEIYLRRGIIAYYDNDVFKAREMLNIAARFFPVPALPQQILGIPRDEKLEIAFTQFYLALIEKNYGDMTKARDHIEKSYAVYGQNEPGELATPVTRAEILSYLEDMARARGAIQEVLNRADALRQIGTLKRHDAAYALRARLLLGNTYYVQGEWQQALDHFQATLEADVRRDNIYYAYNSIAQVHRQLGNEEEAQESRREAYEELVSTGHLQTKVALDTRILLNALAYLCTRDDEPDKAREYREAIQNLWIRIREVNGLELRLFSLERKRPVDKGEFWTEIFS